MAKIKIGTLAKETGVGIEDLLTIAKNKAPDGISGHGKLSWLTEAAADTVRLTLEAPLAVATKTWARITRPARNESWVYGRIDGIDGAVLVAVPRKLRGRLVGKTVPVESITDAANETTYRFDYSRAEAS